MARQPLMRRFAQWHIWLGWLVGVPIVMWVASGLFMVIKPVEQVRGEHLRNPQAQIPLVIEGSEIATQDAALKEMRVVMHDGRAIAILIGLDGVTSRVDLKNGAPLPAIDAAGAREIAAREIVGGTSVRAVTFYAAQDVPFDFRRPMPVWQIALDDGTHVYVGRDTGQIEAVRTRWWRWFDFAWGVHIMDLSERSDTSHPTLISFATLSLLGAALGCILMFRRRKTKPKVKTEGIL